MSAKTCFLAIFFVCGSVAAEPKFIEQIGSWFDSIARSVNLVGKKSGEILSPGLGLSGDIEVNDFSGLVTLQREFNQSFPVAPNALLNIANEFGGIRVDTWENGIVRVVAQITVGAESPDQANHLCSAIDVPVLATEDRVDVSTRYPDTRDLGKVAIEVNYHVTIPKDAAVTCRNYLGDTVVSGTGGALAIDSEFGAVDVRDISGRATVRIRGDFPLQAHNLKQGGTFKLHRTQAAFVEIAGPLVVENYMGTVELRDLAPDSSTEITNENGPIHVYLADNDARGLTVTTLFGEIKSEIPLDRSARGNIALARNGNLESQQRLSLHATFGDVYIHRADGEAPSNPILEPGGQPFKGRLERISPAPEGTGVRLEAIVGDIQVVGTDDDQLRITATPLIRLDSPDNAQAALEALDLQVEEQANPIVVRTVVRGDLAALGCTYYRIDLAVQCPRTCPVQIQAAKGHTAVDGLGAALTVIQAEGVITVRNTKGDLELTNQKGDVEAGNCAGPNVKIVAPNGAVRTQEIYGKQTIESAVGKTVVDTPQGGIFARNRGGGIRIMALAGVLGDYNVATEQGDLSIVVPPTADATLVATAVNGTVRNNSIPLTGTTEKGLQKFSGKLNNGQYTVNLETKEGDIVID
ncbi:MAG: DUF4097 family beta strand repeat protein [Candidatus Hydrogenedentes bacterium]|nr:DUF4097 family beta strand repeat protein [Candidatus Hydrogenedentota bacterium]